MGSFSIAAILVQDGVTTGAVYALLGMALVLLFAVTRIIFFPQGEFVTFGALTLVWLQAGKVPGTVWLMLAMALAAGLLEAVAAWRDGQPQRLPRVLVTQALVPGLIAAATVWAAAHPMPLLVQCGLALAVVAALGPSLYRVIYQPLAAASVLTLMIVSVGVHFFLVGLSLVFFGVDGYRTPAFWDGRLELGALTVPGQSLAVVAVTLVLIVALALFFGRTLWGKALRAAASNHVGARLLAISVPFCGRLSFTIAAFIGGLCGILIGPIVTIYYDSGLLIGLKGFVASIVGGLVSYPLTLAGALGIGIVESFVSFSASAYKETVIFLLVIPVLLFLSLRHGGADEEH
jgi:branched-chain amino acid transport system permease protein